MNARRRFAAVTLATLVVASVGVAAGLARTDYDFGTGSSALSLLAWAVQVSAFSVVGALIGLRRPGHRIAWLLVAIGGLEAIAFAASTVMTWGVQTGSLSRTAANWIGTGTFAGILGLALIGTQLPLRLPDGRCLSPRWRRFSHVALALTAVAGVGAAVQPGRIDEVPGTRNPLGIEGAEFLGSLFGLVILAMFASVVSTVLRYRRAGAHDRAQLRWVGLGGIGFLACYVAALFLLGVEALDDVTEMLFVLAFAALPVSIGVAILRHRLYDIDVVINRALVYASLSVSLAAVYAVTVLVLQAAVGPLMQDSGLAVAVSTLVVAGLFGPVRARVQRGVDRRFFRRRYDAARTLAAFGVRTRDEVDLDALARDLRAVVVETMEPAHVSLWLRETGPR